MDIEKKLLRTEKRIRAVYPDLRIYIAKHMKVNGYTSIGQLLQSLDGIVGHEFLRLMINGMKLPSPQTAKALAKALKVNYAEFLCVVENSRLRKMKVSKYVQVVPFKK